MADMQAPIQTPAVAPQAAPMANPAPVAPTAPAAPMQVVKLPNGDTAQFPSDMAPEKIESILADHAKTNPEIMKAPAPSSNTPTAPGLNAESVLKPVEAAATGWVSGVMDAGRQLAQGVKAVGNTALNAEKETLGSTIGQILPQSTKDLAGSVSNSIGNGIGTLQNKVGDLYNAAEKSLTQNPIALQSQQENPQTFGLAASAGNIGTQVAATNPVMNPLSKAANAGIERAAPLLASPGLKGAINQGLVGGTMGAVQNPEQPVKGALIGAALGSTIGGLAGNLGEKVERAGKIINDTIEDMQASGQNPSTLASIEKIKGNLADSGIVYKNYDIEQAAKAKVEDYLTTIRDQDFVPGTSPLAAMMNHVEANIPKVAEQTKANYAPINEDTHAFPTTNFNAMRQSPDLDLPSLGLPKNLKSGDALTLDDMLKNRTLLDGKIQQAKNAANSGVITKPDIDPYYKLRYALNQDIHDSAQTIPYTNPGNPNVKTLKDQLQIAEDYHNTNVKPFQTLDKNGQYVNNPKATTAAMQQIATQLQARRPNFVKLNNAASILGDEGKSLVQWGVLETGFNKATSVNSTSGEFASSSMRSFLKRINGSGLLSTVFNDTGKQVAKGIGDILDASIKTAPGKADPANIITKGLQVFTHSRLGINTLKFIGNPSIPAQQKRQMISQILSGIAVHAASAQQNQNQQ